MTGLPRELAPWAPFLEAFPDEAAATIWPWLPRLNSLLGPVQVDRGRPRPARRAESVWCPTRRPILAGLRRTAAAECQG